MGLFGFGPGDLHRSNDCDDAEHGASGSEAAGPGTDRRYNSSGPDRESSDPGFDGTGFGGTSASADADADGRTSHRERSSWMLVASLRETAQALALTPAPDAPEICLAEAEDLLFARDRIMSALAERVGRVHRTGQAKQHGHASTRTWLRTVGGMSTPEASRLLTLSEELSRLPEVARRFASGEMAAGVAEAICAATAGMSVDNAALAEPILVELAEKATAAEVSKAGRYLRALLDPDGEEQDEQADYQRRFMTVRPTKNGGVEGQFYLPREAAARLMTLLQTYGKPRAEGDDRPRRVRNADAFIALLGQKVAAELLVMVRAESLPNDDPVTGDAPSPANAPASGKGPATADSPPPDKGPVPDDDPVPAGNPGAAKKAEPDCSEYSGPEYSGPDSTAAADDDPAGCVSGDRFQSSRVHPAYGDGVPAPAPAPADGTRTEQAAPDQGRTEQGRTEQGSPERTAAAGKIPEEPVAIPEEPEGTPDEPEGTRDGPEGGPGTPTALAWALLGTAPGLLLATGQMLPVTSVHRLARTSALVRIVMDADGQVLDMGRKVRLATPAQRRAVFARYATCWVEGCPLPATMCEIDHADNWCSGGLTDLKLLGPACQFHNRDRYRRPGRYLRRKVGEDRWAFTYLGRFASFRQRE
ncbi:DUF222 domain-containing protein [Microbispora sp. NBC_01189]|uniref:DUF222 domain-containing protein n=1 Tax=Microbispora sp. NBC_01189 TaxID=2903583 RepID=UPI002E15B30E|nr:DUF222 domain-containing protein [Microbispora sp. NBC_01189]